LAVSTWDAYVKIYDVLNPGSPQEMRTYYHAKSVLSCCFVVFYNWNQKTIFFEFKDASKVVSGGLDEVVKVCDLETGRGFFKREKY